MTAKGLKKQELSKFLATRGLWLIVVEITWISFAWQLWTYNSFYLQVIWTIGISMICLAGLIHLPKKIILAISLVMIFGHNLLDGIEPETFGDFYWLWNILHNQTYVVTPDLPIRGFLTGYPCIPWIGVMALGYLMGDIFTKPIEERHKTLFKIGGSAIILFVILRYLNIYGDTENWAVQERGFAYTVMSFLNTEKYPPSLLFLLMTLGPSILLMPYFDRMTGNVGRFFAVYGKTPFFFYVLHLPLVHVSSYLLYLFHRTETSSFRDHSSWAVSYEPNMFRWYLMTAFFVFLFYYPCKWFGEYRRTHKHWWLSYI
ncbi:DUF1624 domain-containing protein [Pseudemcibacter aquimaris]|uniref:DUF1624 domain-containing protein n=1 Tax=Pseudemcibacter aquimaris TaxID=2857064 RepID=UPI00201245CD|nr:heparan-alpha-glucosaminide N-acetyltransferase domain-containing protein [Pseudemcibacter aquimaris]MCC3861286.1 heparan-alpha-glucosaminide N-acetyltransferase domain-containing protein [Pseudemcibacter aquimaris]WDU58060.1 DUF1624 domain-containing protein [Pseudemcibacter aquimaris]